MSISKISLLTLSAALVAAPLAAQDLGSRSAGSFSIIQTRPVGALGKNIGFGYGLDGAYLYRLDKKGILSVRAQVGGVQYGEESQRNSLANSARVQVNVRTTNYIIPMSIGPQLTWPSGSVRPYVNAGVGGQAFMTESRVESVDQSVIASTTNQSDMTAAWAAGGGVYIPISANKSAKILLDIGVQYYSGGNSRYLAPGSIVDLPNGQIKTVAMESNTHLMMVRVGARIER